MGSHHRLVDPIVVVLAFAAGDSRGTPDLRRLRRIEGHDAAETPTCAPAPAPALPRVTLG
jgi:hypothetical protein